MGASARMLRWARRKAGLTQRELAERVGVAQSAVARIESGAVVPRVDTLDRLLRACGYTLEAEKLRGQGVDTTLIDEMLDLTPSERLERGRLEAERLSEFLRETRPA